MKNFLFVVVAILGFTGTAYPKADSFSSFGPTFFPIQNLNGEFQKFQPGVYFDFGVKTNKFSVNAYYGGIIFIGFAGISVNFYPYQKGNHIFSFGGGIASIYVILISEQPSFALNCSYEYLIFSSSSFLFRIEGYAPVTNIPVSFSLAYKRKI